jgi:hypothetical protein
VLGLELERLARRAHPRSAVRAPLDSLGRVGDLVNQQLLAVRRGRIEHAAVEVDIRAERKRARGERPRRVGGRLVVVDAHGVEAHAEPRLEVSHQIHWQGAPSGTVHRMGDRRMVRIRFADRLVAVVAIGLRDVPPRKILVRLRRIALNAAGRQDGDPAEVEAESRVGRAATRLLLYRCGAGVDAGRRILRHGLHVCGEWALIAAQPQRHAVMTRRHACERIVPAHPPVQPYPLACHRDLRAACCAA